MLTYPKLLLGAVLGIFSLYYWVAYGHSVPDEKLSPLFFYSFRILPRLDLIVSSIAAYLFLTGGFEAYRNLILFLNRDRKKVYFKDPITRVPGPQKTEVIPSSQKRKRREVLKKLFLTFIFLFAVMSMVGPLFRWNDYESAWVASLALFSPGHFRPHWSWFVFLLSAWTSGAVALLAVLWKKRLPLFSFFPVLAFFIMCLLFILLNARSNIDVSSFGFLMTLCGQLGLALLVIVKLIFKSVSKKG